jgi:3-hydroxyisobutyrate dehydrogenase-like beta-hydroxyacid dehydrogenase
VASSSRFCDIPGLFKLWSERMSDLIAVIAPGEMGAAIGQRLRERGARVITSLAGRSAASGKRAERAGIVAAANDDEIATANIILSVVPPKDAAGLAERLRPAIARAATKPIYVDCNAVAPQTAEAIGAILAGSGASYVDGGIIGPPPTPTTLGARLYVSGERARDVLRLNSYGLDTRFLDGPIGAASALKMSYAGVTKGFTAISALMMLGATRAGCADMLHKELAESQSPLLGWLSRQMPKMPPKAYRWVAEMEEIGTFLDGIAGGRDAYEAIARLYQHIAEVQAAPRVADDTVAQLDLFCAMEAPASVRKTA